MHFKVRNFKYKSIPRIPRVYNRRTVIRLGRFLLILLLVWAFIFIQTLRKNFRPITFSNHNISAVMIDNLNSEENVLNTKSYGEIKDDTVIFVVLLDGFSKEFNISLNSLSQVRGIEDAFIIFSYYYYDENLNNIITNIDYCRVLQIFYPYSLPTHNLEFPSLKPSDCLNTDEKAQAKCTDAYFLDNQGHYKNGKKHHWWWTANHVFERLKCTKKHTGLVIFMKDDLIFTKDFIYMAMYMKDVAGSLPRCEFLSMGTSSVSDTKYTETDLYSAKLTVWNPKIHSSVLAFDVRTWDIVAAHYDLFCDLKDTSWSRTLHYISRHRMDRMEFKVISSVAPRAFKISSCKWFCDGNTANDVSSKFENVNEDSWFPPYVELYIDIEMSDNPEVLRDEPTASANPRDKALCYFMSTSKIKKVIMTLNT